MGPFLLIAGEENEFMSRNRKSACSRRNALLNAGNTVPVFFLSA